MNQPDNYFEGIISQEGNYTKGHKAHYICIDHIPNSVTQGLLMQEDPSGHLQGEQSSTSNGIGSRKRKDETKRVARKFPILCAPALVPPLSAKPHSILVLEIEAAGR